MNLYLYIGKYNLDQYFLFCLSDYSASLGSEEESGKDWDELEEEARKGEYKDTVPLSKMHPVDSIY